MGSLFLTIAATLTVMPPPAVATPYRAKEAVSDAMLDTVRATALPGFARNARSMSDGNAQLGFQQIAAGGRIAMDNWWAQNGAALIVDNLASPPASR